MNEIWKNIENYEGLYQVSNLGQVRSLKSGETKNLKPGNNGRGYLFVILYKDGKMKRLYLHRLVAKAFIPNPLGYPVINHKDENPSNNHVSNLEWCSVRYNTCYGTSLKRIAAKLSKPVLQYDKQNNFLRRWPSTMEVERKLGFHQAGICACSNGKCKTAYGFVWRYEK